MTIEGLKSKGTYEFRISAENKHGQSRPCVTDSNRWSWWVVIGRRRRGYDGLLIDIDTIR